VTYHPKYVVYNYTVYLHYQSIVKVCVDCKHSRVEQVTHYQGIV